MKEDFIKILREATDSKTVYTPSPSIIDTPSQATDPNETNYQYAKEPAYYTNPNEKGATPTVDPISNISPNKNLDQFIEDTPASNISCDLILSVWRALFPTIPSGISLLPRYSPASCCNKNYNFNFSGSLTSQQTARLIREIYLRILRSLDTYSLVIKKGSNNFQKDLVLLRTQMQVLSGAILNVYQDYTATNVVPLRVSINSYVPKNLPDSICYLHDEIYHIYYLLSKLIFTLQNDTNFFGQLEIILNNLKYQLSILNTIYLSTTQN